MKYTSYVHLFLILIPQLIFADDSGCDGSAPGTANPAAVYCVELGYEYQIIETPRGQRGICVFPDKSWCAAWDFLEGKCGQEHSYCAQCGYDVMTVDDGLDPFSPEYAVCIDKQGREVGSVVSLTHLVEKAVKGSVHTLPGGLPIDHAPTNRNPSDLPDSLDWRNRNGFNWVTPVKDQGTCGSCWAFSAVGIVEAIHDIYADNPDLDLDLSEQYLVSDCYSPGIYNNCCGGYLASALGFIRDEGIPDELCMSYIDGTGCSCPGFTCSGECTYHQGIFCSDATCSDKCGDWLSRLVSISYIWMLPSNQPDLMKERLTNVGPLAAGMNISGYWDGDIMRCYNDSTMGHAVVIVGYNDLEQYWIIKNSWGDDWHEDGYAKVGYGECGISTCICWAELFPQAWHVSSTGDDQPGNGTQEAPFATIQRAVDYAHDGDTVFIGEGTYYETIEIGKSLYLIGLDRNAAIIDGESAVNCIQIDTGADSGIITGLTIRNASQECIRTINGRWHINGNIISGGGVSIGSNCLAKNNLILGGDSSYAGLSLTSGDSIIVYNNVISGFSTGINIGSGVNKADIQDNIIEDNSGYGIDIEVYDPLKYTVDYNNFWNNGWDGGSVYQNCPPGEHDIDLNPQFVGGNPYDYSLQCQSPCRDAGNPNFPLDPDGSISDMGAYPYDPNSCVDSDGDCYGDPEYPENKCAVDNCPTDYNPDQLDSDGDGQGDACEYYCGDANGDSQINVGDAVFLISYVFNNGPSPEPIEAGDANCDGYTNIGDGVYVIAYVFSGGPEPCCPR